MKVLLVVSPADDTGLLKQVVVDLHVLDLEGGAQGDVKVLAKS
jgi:hypothetical protein